MRLLPIAFVAAAGLATLPFALADEAPAPAKAPSTDGCRVEVIPAHRACVAREVTTPAVTCAREVPVYETVKVPVFESRCVTDYRDEQAPVFSTREVPAFEDRQVPDYGQVPVTVYRDAEDEVGFNLPNPFSCDCKKVHVHLWNRCKKVACGTEMQPGIVGWHTERVPCGTRTETFQSGTETRKVVAGMHEETVKVGERDERRCTGSRMETVIVAPETKQTVNEVVDVPAQTVTVTAGDPAKAKQLPGTTMIVTDEQYQESLAAIR